MASERTAKAIAEFQLSDIERGSHKVLDRSPFVIRSGSSTYSPMKCMAAALLFHMTAGPAPQCIPSIVRPERQLCCTGAVADWPACTRWRGDAGIDRLDSLAGHEPVQVNDLRRPRCPLRITQQAPCLCPARETCWDPSLLHPRHLRAVLDRRTPSHAHAAACCKLGDLVLQG